ncbi:TPA: hypothetical protein SK288_002507 [Yersinia enterocolitica]|nr:hypothetical protein [Yersinia enterocolitica]
MLSKEQLEKIANQGPVDIGGAQNPIVTEMATELLSLREQLAELKASIGFNVGDRVCDSVDKFGYGYVVSINNGRSEYPISVQFDKSDKGRVATYTADGRKLSGCPVCLYKTPSVTAAKPAAGLGVEDITEFMRKAFWRGFESARGTENSNIPADWKDSKPNLLLALNAKMSGA